MAWLAFDRAVRSAEEFDLAGPVDRWRSLAAEIHADVCRRGFDHELGSFVQAYGSKQLDASLLSEEFRQQLPEMKHQQPAA